MKLRDQLVRVADCYGAALGIGRQRVSTIVLNRGPTLDGLATGEKDVNTATFERAMKWLDENWPAGTAWPADVERPSASNTPSAPADLRDYDRKACSGGAGFPFPSSGSP